MFHSLCAHESLLTTTCFWKLSKRPTRSHTIAPILLIPMVICLKYKALFLRTDEGLQNPRSITSIGTAVALYARMFVEGDETCSLELSGAGSQLILCRKDTRRTRYHTATEWLFLVSILRKSGYPSPSHTHIDIYTGKKPPASDLDWPIDP